MKNLILKTVIWGTVLTLPLTSLVYASGKVRDAGLQDKPIAICQNDKGNKAIPGKKGWGGFKGRKMTEEQKARMLEKAKELLSEQLKNGKITQEQYDAAIANIEAGKMPEIPRPNGPFRGRKMTEEQKAKMLEKAKELLSEQLKNGKITQEQYDAAITNIEAGKMPPMGFGQCKGKGSRTFPPIKRKVT